MVVLFLLGCAVSSLGNLLTGLAWAMAAAFSLQLLRGSGLSAIDIGVNTLIQRQVPAAMTGRVFGTLYGAVGAAAAMSYLAGAALLETTGPRAAFSRRRHRTALHHHHRRCHQPVHATHSTTPECTATLTEKLSHLTLCPAHCVTNSTPTLCPALSPHPPRGQEIASADPITTTPPPFAGPRGGVGCADRPHVEPSAARCLT